MAAVDPTVVEMPEDADSGLMPPYRRLVTWATVEVEGLTDDQLDLDDHSPDKEWMW